MTEEKYEGGGMNVEIVTVAPPTTAVVDANTIYEADQHLRQMSHMPSDRTLSPAEFVAQYDAADQAIHKIAKRLVVAIRKTKDVISELLPQLDKMQSLVSKKGANFRTVKELNKQGKGYQPWADYYAELDADYNLGVTLRTIQRKLAEYRNDPTEPKEPKRQPWKLKQSDLKALTKAAAIGYELCQAYLAGRSIDGEVGEYLKLVNQKRLDDILNPAGE